jgi:hypothetical protein
MAQKARKTIAVMQPYFIPYTGYFRLLSETDLFVIYDCVQFQRRGWLHRNMLPDHNGTNQWLTLPLEKAPQSVLIKDLKLTSIAKTEISNRLKRFPLQAADSALEHDVLAQMVPTTSDTVDYICGLLKYFADYLGISWNVVKSSSLGLPDYLRGADRIIEIAKRLDGTHYLNAPGGRDLYDVDHFAKNDLTLQFLSEYSGNFSSILSRVLTEERENILSDLKAL